ncbi:MAG: hypothetical protein SPK50_05750 [Mobiluncus porci]|uniref:Type II toxin-antitoxin system HicA family toxin n=1 Tax=Mobiluncus porci TaxID=2652278 RepID=A0A7K0K4K6_9ACTO|nr:MULTISPECIES: hypothetical protein [Mobiluncus]MDD7541768.1 hypothetical protein [Mobiluncus porci]MDY5748616.1 hypothetical protein [Mobiluncus porci]MST50374.1 hypothetical protein [Mobiluncus porci]
MRRNDLLKRLRKIASEKGLTFELVEGGNHTKVRIGGRTLIVPRHTEINEMTARGILKDAEKESSESDD